MATASYGPVQYNLPNHPDLEELFKIIAFAQNVFVAEGKDPNTGDEFVMVTAPAARGTYKFTKTAVGYELTK
jgi:hypothetical protein